jgi:MinD superfamily P-loop ATPase
MNLKKTKDSNYCTSAKQLVIISGKGGTGKTTLAAAFAALAEKTIVADCDVDAANLFILLKPEILHTYAYKGNKKAKIDLSSCTECSLCTEYCRFDAIRNFQVDTIACEGCGFCYRICPENAIEMKDVISGHYYKSIFSGGNLYYAALEPGEGNSGKLVTEVKKQAFGSTNITHYKWYLVDGPPGIGCPVNASIAGADFAVIITEPTVSGLHDLERVAKVVQRFATSTCIVINKYNLNLNMVRQIEAFALRNNMQISGKIPFDETVDRALLEKKNIMEFRNSPAAREISNIWDKVNLLIKQ